MPVPIVGSKADSLLFEQDEHPKPETKLEILGEISAPFSENGCITVGNTSVMNDRAAALLLASEMMAKKQKLTPIPRIVGMVIAGFEPIFMGYGPFPATI